MSCTFFNARRRAAAAKAEREQETAEKTAEELEMVDPVDPVDPETVPENQTKKKRGTSRKQENHEANS